MSLAEIKESVPSLTAEERRQLALLLETYEESSDPEHQRRMAEKIDDQDPDNWLTADEFRDRLRELDTRESK